MEGSSRLKDAEDFLRRMRASPAKALAVLLVAATSLAGGAFLESFFKELGEHEAKATVEVEESGPIGRLVPSRISPLSYRVDVINNTSEVDDSGVKSVVRALQDQVQNDFAPVWGVSAKFRFVPRGKAPDPDSWWLAILDDADQAGALGYHDERENGLPIAKVFVRTAGNVGFSWSVTASHELLEMLIDPRINLNVLVSPADGKPGTLWSYEVANPCENEKFAYKKDGVLVSDFVTPAWFDPNAKRPGSRFDFRDQIDKPFGLLEGGYAATYDLKSGQWKMITK
jgi:hypothetical protein